MCGFSLTVTEWRRNTTKYCTNRFKGFGKTKPFLLGLTPRLAM